MEQHLKNTTVDASSPLLWQTKELEPESGT